MKRALIALLVPLMIGCREPDIPQIEPEEPLKPTHIAGLKLDFRKVNISWGYTSIVFTNASTGFITTMGGFILRTDDGGKTWKDLPLGNYVVLNKLFFLNENEGWAVGGTTTCYPVNCTPRGAIMYHTTDGGATWSEIKLSLSKKVVLNSVHFLDSNTGIVITDDIIMRTTDGGVTWTEMPQDTYVSYGVMARLYDITFLDDKNGIISAGASRIFMTEDGGLTWSRKNPFNDISVSAISQANHNVIYASSETSLFKSTDFGKTWSKQSANFPPVSRLKFISEDIGFAFGYGDYVEVDGNFLNRSAIFYTKDGGQTWTGVTNVHEASVIATAATIGEQAILGIADNSVVEITLK